MLNLVHNEFRRNNGLTEFPLSECPKRSVKNGVFFERSELCAV